MIYPGVRDTSVQYLLAGWVLRCKNIAELLDTDSLLRTVQGRSLPKPKGGVGGGGLFAAMSRLSTYSVFKKGRNGILRRGPVPYGPVCNILW
jgi:hypothetical protein